MDQATMTAQSVDSDGALFFKYGGKPAVTAMGCAALILVLYGYKDMTSSTTEWHLFSTRLPIIIPNQVMVGLWWLCLAISAYATLLSIMPSVRVVLNDREITAQSLLTRKFKTITYADIMDLTIRSNYITVIDKNNIKINLTKLLLSKAAFNKIGARLEQAAPHAV